MPLFSDVTSNVNTFDASYISATTLPVISQIITFPNPSAPLALTCTLALAGFGYTFNCDAVLFSASALKLTTTVFDTLLSPDKST